MYVFFRTVNSNISYQILPKSNDLITIILYCVAVKYKVYQHCLICVYFIPPDEL